VVDLDTIPLADPDDQAFTSVPRVEQVPGRRSRRSPVFPSRYGKWISIALIVVLCFLHGLAIWCGLGGRAGLTNGWPLWRDDHPLYYHTALVTRSFLKSSWTTAGYDPSFMAGYAKSVVFPSSSTLPELVIAAFGGDHPEFAYKIYVLISAAAVPWLIALACMMWRIPVAGASIAVVLDLLYIWTDFPINYVTFGMLPYFLAVPVGLAATGAFARFLARGGPIDWLVTAVLMSMAFLFHLTTAMVIVPAAAAAYAAAILLRRTEGETGVDRRRERVFVLPVDEPERKLAFASHLAVWALPIVVLAVNAFWWLPGVWLTSTKGASDFAFAHPEGVMRRLLQILASEAPIQAVLLAAGLPGLFLIYRRGPAQGLALIMFCGAGIFWGYLAGGLRALDFLQPGRHTYACFTALAVAGGAGFEELRQRLRLGRNGPDHLDRWVTAGVILIGMRLLAFPQPGSLGLIESLREKLASSEPFLSSWPSQRLLWVVDRVKRNVQPGERLLYEEGGFGPDPFQRGRFSGLLPERTGVEVIGGPYLHASLQTNFTQFGEGMLFGRSDWDRPYFVQYATLYRPSAILCWSPRARRFCQANPDLVKVLEDDGTVLIGRVMGFEGDFIEGKGRIEASARRIRVREITPGLDGSVLLRYHSVPYLTTSPPVALESERHLDDPVPFIRLRPPAGTRAVELELRVPVGVGH
jgi:hypothetical protein